MRRFALAIVVLLIGCGPAMRDCPAPIGPVLIEDCSVYQRRTAALRVEVLGVFAGATVTGSAQRTTLRTPSEGFEVLADRLHALCRDHNTCRTQPTAYDQKRQQLDAHVLQVGGLVDQIKAAETHADRARLRAELARTLERVAQGTARVQRTKMYDSSLPWMGTRTPAAQLPERDAPHLIGHSFGLDHQFDHGMVGYRPNVRAQLWWPNGTYATDDALVVAWSDGSTSACPMRGRHNGPGHISVGCKAPKASVFTAAKVSVRLSYRRGIDGSELPIGTATGQVLSAPKAKPDHYGFSQDHLIAQAQLVYRPLGRTLPATEGEQPHVVVVLRLRDHARPTLRCAVNGVDQFGALRVSGRHSGQAGTFRDRPRWEKTGPHSSQGVKNAHIEWWRFDWALPFVAHGEAQAPLKPWPVVGDWRCRVIIEGTAVRHFQFHLDDQGRPLLPDAVLPIGPAWPLSTAEAPR